MTLRQFIVFFVGTLAVVLFLQRTYNQRLLIDEGHYSRVQISDTGYYAPLVPREDGPFCDEGGCTYYQVDIYCFDTDFSLVCPKR